MRPLTMITGILMGSSLAITVSLGMVILVFLLLGADHPRVSYEFRPLVSTTVVFLTMTALTALSFYTLLIRHRARFVAQGLMWLGLACAAWYLWP